MPAQPAFSSRAIFLASQSRNSYETMPVGEAIQLLQEMLHWGYNQYWFQFDRTQYDDIFDHRTEDDNGQAEWSKLKTLADSARALDMKVAFVSPTNICYRNQTDDASCATTDGNTESGYVWEQVCPSKTRGRETILRNFRNLFEDLPSLDIFCLVAYGDGGCRCKECRPWAKTFIGLAKEIAEILYEYHPNAELLIFDWRFSEKEITAVAQFLKQEKPTWVHGIVKSDRNSADVWSKQELPIQYRQVAFVDISKVGGWANFGANPFPRRLQEVTASLADSGFDSLVAYSDEVHDDLNKVFLSEFAKEPDASLQDVCRKYATRYLGHGMDQMLYEIVQLAEGGWSPRTGAWFNQLFAADDEDVAELASLLTQCDDKLGSHSKADWRWQTIRHRVRIGEFLLKLGTVDELTDQITSTRKMAEALHTRAELLTLIDRIRELLDHFAELLAALRDEVDQMRTAALKLDDERWPRLDVTSNIFEGRWGQSWPAWQRAIWRMHAWLDACCNERSPQSIRRSLGEIPKLQSGKTGPIARRT